MLRPRESYAVTGPAPLADEQLLALALGTGTRGRPPVAIARELLDRFGSIAGVAAAEPAELREVSGVGLARAVRLHAALTLGDRARRRPHFERTPIRDPDDAATWLVPGLEGLEHEELHGLFLDRRHRPLALRTLTVGSPTHTVVDPRQVFTVALRVSAAAVILAHNHPSGDPTPSPQDRDVTRRVVAAGRTLGVPLLDHLVVGHGRYVAMQL